jgi:SpoVK/Ycf46/Vps4 family AAA+-type ATPase
MSQDFYPPLARILNSGQSRSVLLHGNTHDLYPTDGQGYQPLLTHLVDKCNVPGLIVLVYELNGPIRVAPTRQREDTRPAVAAEGGGASGGGGDAWARIRSGWIAWKSGVDYDQLVLQSLADRNRQRERKLLEDEFDGTIRDTTGQPTVALEFLRQLTLCSRSTDARGRAFIPENLLILIEAADMLLPAGSGGADVAGLNAADRHRVIIARDWFGDPGFMTGRDSVILLAESRSLIHPRVTGIPQLLSVEVSAPDEAARLRYIHWHLDHEPRQPSLWSTPDDLARLTAGLSIHALRQLLIGAAHAGGQLQPIDVIDKVEDFIQSQLGEDVVEFSKPSHSLDDVIGFRRLKAFIGEELLPRFRSSGADALPGAAVAGPIGGGKTFIFEAVAAAMDVPVLVIKNIRSQWFGQTDVIFERLRRVLEALGKVIIFVDEADTQFGGVGADAHETERRLTGKVQAMMSDPRLRGRVVWLLMTARIHRLSPDIRRPGRVGDLIIPILDPEHDGTPDSDRNQFLRWCIRPALGRDPTDDEIEAVAAVTSDYSAAAFAALRSNLRAKAIRHGGDLDVEQVKAIVHDLLPPDIAEARRYQTLQALINCTRRSLLPDPEVDEATRLQWQQEIRSLEARGIQ